MLQKRKLSMKKHLLSLLFISLLFSGKTYGTNEPNNLEMAAEPPSMSQIAHLDMHKSVAMPPIVKMPKPSFYEKIFPREKLPVTLSCSGYVKNEFWWDTYQIKGARDDQFLFYPLARD